MERANGAGGASFKGVCVDHENGILAKGGVGVVCLLSWEILQ